MDPNLDLDQANTHILLPVPKTQFSKSPLYCRESPTLRAGNHQKGHHQNSAPLQHPNHPPPHPEKPYDLPLLQALTGIPKKLSLRLSATSCNCIFKTDLFRLNIGATDLRGKYIGRYILAKRRNEESKSRQKPSSRVFFSCFSISRGHCCTCRKQWRKLADFSPKQNNNQLSEKMNQKQQSILLNSSSRFPPPPGVKFSYGTAGFRADASLLESTVFRVGILAALRSIQTGSAIGLMITASHNKVSDNGVKVADPSGGMLTQQWEPFADAIANAPDPNSLIQLLDDFVKKENITVEGAPAAEVLLGRDTRPSGMALVEAAKQGITSIMGATATDMGVVTTPQLHWMVRAKNKGLEASEDNYFNQLLISFRCLLDYVPQGKSSNVNDKLIVDGADGVGGEKLEKLRKNLSYLTIDVRNYGDGVLNEDVGADYVQKEKVVPRSFGPADTGIRCSSLDGDADRLVYFSVLPNSNKIDLVDGDKILSLFALYLKEQLCILNGPEDGKANNSYQVSLGVVQTAYANGASTDYLKRLGLEVALSPTGVKYLHEKAADYDVGIYFEANGHGTILFSDAFLSWLEIRHNELSSTSKGSDQHKAALRLLAVSKLINQAVGDALSGLLLVEAILQHMGWSIHKWNELYHDLPSRQLKVKVVDRNAVITENAETVVVSPVGIQDAINAETGKYPQGRCFIRPSGTEDVVRVYAEALTQEAADTLAQSVVKLVDHYLGSPTNS